MKHNVGVAVWRGVAVGQMEPRNLFNENFVDSYPRNFKFHEIKVLYAREDYTNGDAFCSLIIIYWTVPVSLAACIAITVSDSLVTKICPRELASVIYCIAWSSFSLQRAKTSNFQIHRITERMVYTWMTSNLPIDIFVTFVLLHHMQKGTKLSPSSLFIVVVRGESLGTRLA